MCYSCLSVSDEVLDRYSASLTDHIRYVQEAGKNLGVPREQLGVHDESKWSAEELYPYARQFQGGGAGECFERAWLHHIHYNPHHWQHWLFPTNSFNIPPKCFPIPPNYALEMVADWMGASRAYTGSWDMTDWLKRNIPNIRVHSDTAVLLRRILTDAGYGHVVDNHCFAGECP